MPHFVTLETKNITQEIVDINTDKIHGCMRKWMFQ